MRAVVAHGICEGEPRLRLFSDVGEANDFADTYGMEVLDASVLEHELHQAEVWLSKAESEVVQALIRVGWLRRAQARLAGAR